MPKTIKTAFLPLTWTPTFINSFFIIKQLRANVMATQWQHGFIESK